MPDTLSNQELLLEAVARNAAAMVTLPSAGMEFCFRTRLLETGETGLYIESKSEIEGRLRELVANAKPIEVQFNVRGQRMGFQSSILDVEPAHQLNAGMTVHAARLAPPQQLEKVQRRAAYRLQVPATGILKMRAWSIPEHVPLRDRPLASQELKVQLMDISLGGFRAGLRDRAGKTVRLVSDQRLRVQLLYQDIDLILEARCRGLPDGEYDSYGLAFTKLQTNLEGRQALTALTKIVGELQRDEIRRARMAS